MTTYIQSLVLAMKYVTFVVRSDGTGFSKLPNSTKKLSFEAHSWNDEKSMLGAPYQLGTWLGYKAADFYSIFANAEHEFLHLWLCEYIWDRCSPNHAALINGDDPGEIAELEEILVTSLQLYLNGATLNHTARFALAYALMVSGCDFGALIQEATKAHATFRAQIDESFYSEDGGTFSTF